MERCFDKILKLIADGKWSMDYGSSAVDYRLWAILFFLLSFSASAQTITRAEYFFDNDPGVGNATALPVTPNASINQTYNLSTSSLAAGFHSVNVRVRDNTGKWSLFATRTFYVISNPFGIAPSVNITKAEYFYDTDPGVGNGINIPVTASATVNLTVNAPTTALTAGFHNVNVRVRDDQGRWSLFSTRTFYLMPVSALPANLVKLEYFVNTDPGIGQATQVAVTQAPTVNQLFNLNLPVLTPGSYTLNVRAKDSNGYWSNPVVSAPFTITACTPPNAPAANNGSVCGSGTVSLSATGATGTQVYRWYVDSGTSTISFSGSPFITPTLSATTTYFVSIFDPATSCESTRSAATAAVNPIPSAPTTIGASGCAPSASVTLTASGGSGGQYRWYTTASGGSAIAGQNNSSYTTATILVTTIFYVAINNGTCESNRTAVTASIQTCATPPSIATQPLTAVVGGKTQTLDLTKLITTSGANLDVNSITVITTPSSGAKATITNGQLTIDYSGIAFAGKESITIRACDVNGNCATQQFEIDVAGDIIVYNAVSPNGANPTFELKYIQVLPETQNNVVTIFDRWQNEVWRGENYNNGSVVFSGNASDGTALPTGTYFYRIDFGSGKKSKTGFISLRR